MKIKCTCGKMLQIPDSFAGKKAKCPSCGHIISVGNSAPAPSGGKLTVQCSCGQKLAVPAAAAGKKVRCPSCEAEVAVPPAHTSAPAPAPAPEPAAAAEPATEATEEEFLFEVDMGNRDPDPAKKKDDSEFEVAGAKCPNCGASLDAAAQFCVACGTHMATGTQADGVNMKEIKERKDHGRQFKLIIVIGIAVVVAALAVTLAIVGFGKKGVKPPSNRPPAKTSRGLPPNEARGTEAQRMATPPLEPKANEGYLEKVVYAPGRIKVQVDKIGVKQAIQAFQAEHGRLPESLEELKSEYTLPKLPDDVAYEYDPETGEIGAYRVRDRQPQESARDE